MSRDQHDQYLVEEVGVDYADGLISRREAMRRLYLMGVGAVAASSLLAACAPDGEPAPTPTPTASPSPVGESPGEGALPTQEITFAGPRGPLYGAFAAASEPLGAVLLIHENRGLTDHFRDVAGRLARDGYSTLALDLLSQEGGTATLADEAAIMAALREASAERFVQDLRAGLDELERRAPQTPLAMVGFCFGGGQTWALLNAGEPRLAAAAPFYGTHPEPLDLSGSQAAVLAVYGELDARVNATRDSAQAALDAAGTEHEVVTFPGADHAFFNDTGQRYNAAAAAQSYEQLLQWFGRHLR